MGCRKALENVYVSWKVPKLRRLLVCLTRFVRGLLFEDTLGCIVFSLGMSLVSLLKLVGGIFLAKDLS